MKTSVLLTVVAALPAAGAAWLASGGAKVRPLAATGPLRAARPVAAEGDDVFEKDSRSFKEQNARNRM